MRRGALVQWLPKLLADGTSPSLPARRRRLDHWLSQLGCSGSAVRCVECVCGSSVEAVAVHAVRLPTSSNL